MIVDRKRRQVSQIRADLAEARLAADVGALRRLYREGARHAAQGQEFLLPLARLCEELGEVSEAQDAWQRAFQNAPSLEAGYGIMRLRGRHARKAASLLGEALGPRAPAFLEERLRSGTTAPRLDARHLAICGVSYCGSTILGRLLDSCIGFHDVSEAHWLIDRRGAADGRKQIDFTAPRRGEDVLHCWQCGADCPVLSDSFRADLLLNRSHFYFRIAERLDTATLVTGDKNFAKYAQLDPLLRFDAIILFKSPLRAWQSYYKKQPAADEADQDAALDSFIQSWIREYASALRMKNAGGKFFVHFDAFIAEPEAAFRRLTTALGAAPGRRDLSEVAAGRHSIGGNLSSMDMIMANGRIELRKPEALVLPERHVETLSRHAAINELFQNLKARSETCASAG